MPFHVHNAVFSTGERFPILLCDDLRPALLPLFFVVSVRREAVETNTLYRDVRVLGHLYQWAEGKGIDLEHRLRNGTLRPVEIRELSEYLRSPRTKLIGAVEKAGNAKGGGEATHTHVVLHPNTHAAYMDVVEAFLVWAIRSYSPSGIKAEDVPDWIETSESQIREQFGGLRSWANSPPYEDGLTDEEVVALCKLVDPENEKNPFKTSMRLRNYCIIMLLLHAGLRRGELLKLTIDQLPKGPKRTLTVSRDTSNDIRDSRRVEPRAKTWGREVGIPPTIARAIAAYERRDRSRKRAGATPYLFLNNRGVPLNYSGIHEIFLRLRKSLPAMGSRLHAHALRHTCVSRWMRLCHEQGLGDAETQLVLAYYFGWSPRSRMPARYASSWIKDLTTKMLVTYQSQFQ